MSGPGPLYSHSPCSTPLCHPSHGPQLLSRPCPALTRASGLLCLCSQHPVSQGPQLLLPQSQMEGNHPLPRVARERPVHLGKTSGPLTSSREMPTASSGFQIVLQLRKQRPGGQRYLGMVNTWCLQCGEARTQVLPSLDHPRPHRLAHMTCQLAPHCLLCS